MKLKDNIRIKQGMSLKMLKLKDNPKPVDRTSNLTKLAKNEEEKEA